MEKTKTQYAMINASVSSLVYIFKMILSFISRTVFVYFLSKEYLGVNGLFTSIISMLSLAELGIGQSITYTLYKPVAKKKWGEVKSLMKLYKKIYSFIGIAVGIFGLFLLPFLNYFTRGISNIPDIQLIFLLYLVNAVFSYFFTYNRSLLSANQKNYVTIINDFIFFVLVIILQILFLFFTQNFIMYLLVQIVGTLMGNIALFFIVKKEFKVLFDYNEEKINKEDITTLKKNTFGNFLGKIGSVVVTSTDNIYISAFVSVVSLGVFSNYTLIITSIQSLISQIITAVTGSVGQMATEDNYDRGLEVFRKQNFINYSLIFFSSIFMLSMINPLVFLWLGKEYLLNKDIIVLLIVNYVLRGYRQTSWVFMDAYGLAWKLKYKPIVEAILNIVFSGIFLLIFNLGIRGVLLGTLISTLTTVIWWEPYVVFKYGIHKKFTLFIEMILRDLLVLLIAGIFVFYVSNYIYAYDIKSLVICFFSTTLISFSIYILVFYKTEEFKFVKRLFLDPLKR